MKELEEFLRLLVVNTVGPEEDQQRFLHNISVIVPFLVVLVVILGTCKKKTTQTTVHNRFVALQNRLIKALELEETAFLTEATMIHEEYKALLKAYELLHGEEQKK